jgi:hypothetical protein
MDGTEAPSTAISNQGKSARINILRDLCALSYSMGTENTDTHINCDCSFTLHRVNRHFIVFFKTFHSTFPRISELKTNQVTFVPVTENNNHERYLNVRFKSNEPG